MRPARRAALVLARMVGAFGQVLRPWLKFFHLNAHLLRCLPGTQLEGIITLELNRGSREVPFEMLKTGPDKLVAFGHVIVQLHPPVMKADMRRGRRLFRAE